MLERNHKVGWFKYYFPEPSGAMAHGRLTANFNSLEEVSVWVKAWNEHGENGELMLRIWLAREAEAEGVSRGIATVWLADAEARRASDHAANELRIAHSSAAAANRSANWTMVAALFAALGTAITALATIWGLVKSPQTIEVTVVNAEEFGGHVPLPFEAPLQLRMSRKLNINGDGKPSTPPQEL